MFSLFKGKDISIDLGTANTLIYMDGEIILNEPSVVAIKNNRSKDIEVVAVGMEAKNMLGRTPGSINAIRPMKDGVIADFKITEKMLQYFIKKVLKDGVFSPSPRVLICVPCGATQVERRAIKESALGAGAKDVFLIEEPMAAALGAGLEVDKAFGTMVVDIGGGTTEIAVMSLGGVVYSDSLRIGGDIFDDNIIKHVRRKKGIVIGENTAERIKTEIGCAFKSDTIKTANFKGRDVAKGIPVEFEMTNIEVLSALQDALDMIVNAVKVALEQTPPELSADIAETGLMLAGGGSLLHGLNDLIAAETGLSTTRADDPLTCVARGGGLALELIGKKNIELFSSE
jgi:rod shape-determining protein MreB